MLNQFNEQLLELHDLLDDVSSYGPIKFKIDELDEHSMAYKKIVKNNQILLNFLNRLKEF